MKSVDESHGPTLHDPFVTLGIDMVVKFRSQAEDAILDAANPFVLRRLNPRSGICQDCGNGKSQDKESEGEKSHRLSHFDSPPFSFSNKRYHTRGRLLSVLLVGLMVTSCAGVGGFKKPRVVPAEFRQKVGLHVHDKPERFYYPGSAGLDVSDLMAFHLQQVLPFTAESAFKELFSDVELTPRGAKIIHFQQPDLAGYFEIKVMSMRYDYPDSGASTYRGEAALYVEFKTFQEDVIWRDVFQGEGVGFTDPDVRLTRFGREAASALEEAFQNAVYEMQDAILESQTLRDYFRLYQVEQAKAEPPPPSETTEAP